MATMTVKDMQTALVRAGFPVGRAGVDGIWGRDSIEAAKKFQRAVGLPGGGTPGPGTWAAMRAILEGKDMAAAKAAAAAASAAPSQVALSSDPVWFAEARRKMGLHETRNRSTLMSWLRSDGKTLGDPSKLPWCGDFVETAIALTLPKESMVANPYLARNWLKFGRSISQPALGAILVFWRGSRNGTQGHVGFCAGADPGSGGYFDVLGGNQSNAVTIARLDKSRLLGIRWPQTAALPTNAQIAMLRSAGGAISHNEA